MKWLFLVLVLFFSMQLFSHPEKKNNILTSKVVYPAYFPGLQNRDSIKVEELIRSRRMMIQAQGMKVFRFTMTIECPAGDIEARLVTSDSLSDSDVQFLRSNRYETQRIITFDAIKARGDNGGEYAGKAFMFWVGK